MISQLMASGIAATLHTSNATLVGSHRAARAAIALACLVASSATAPLPIAGAASAPSWGRLGPRAAAAGSAPGRVAVLAVQTAARLPAQPVSMAVDSRTGRVFVVTKATASPYPSWLTVLDAATGKVVHSSLLGLVQSYAAGQWHKTDPVYALCPACIAVDEQSQRVFVVGYDFMVPTGPFNIFTFDAATGKLLTTTSLQKALPDYDAGTLRFFPKLLVDTRTNRLFATNGNTNTLAVLDATTGTFVHSVVFPYVDRGQLIYVAPIGVDSRDARVVVTAPNGSALVDERTGANPHYIPVPATAIHAVVEAVDGKRGRGILSVVEKDQYRNSVETLESIVLATGKVLGSFSGGPFGGGVVLLDEQSGRAVLYYPSSQNDYNPAAVGIVDDATGLPVGGAAVSDQTNVLSSGEATAVLNPVTGHALVVSMDDQPALPANPVRLSVFDLHTGKLLRSLRLPDQPYNGPSPSIVADGPTKHVFVTNATNDSVAMYDASKL